MTRLQELIDEVHAAKTRGVIDVLDTATGTRRAAAMSDPAVIVIGDRIRFSVELIRQIAAEPDFTSHVVEVQQVRLEADGTKLIVLGQIRARVPQTDGAP